MAIKPALCGADQSSSFGHSRPSTRTHMTIYDTQLYNTDPCPHSPLTAATRIMPNTPSYDALNHTPRASGHLTKLLTSGIILV
jgi:hypothetical protein